MRVVSFALLALLIGSSPIASQFIPKRTQQQQKAIDLINIAYDSLFANNITSAKELMKQSLNISEQINFVTGRGMYERALGYVAQVSGDVPKALTHFYRTLELYAQDGYLDGIAAVKIDLGSISLEAGDREKARRYFTESLEMYRNMNDTSGVASNYINLGLVFEAEGNYDANLANLQKAAELFKILRDTLRLGIAYNNSAPMYFRKNRLQEALRHRLMALECYRAVKRPDLMRMIYSSIAETFRVLGQLDSARSYLILGLEENLAVDNAGNLAVVYEYLYKLDSTTGRFKEALYDQAMWSHYLERTNNIKKNSEITRTEMRYELLQQEALAQQALDRERLILYAIFGSIATLLTFTVVFLRQRYKILREKARSEELLLNILPAETAEELKATGTSAARQYDNVTVMFTNLVNLSDVADNLASTVLVEEVHKHFAAFDTIIERHGLEKIKSIGDAYLSVGGLPQQTDDHALRVIRAAIEIVDHMRVHGKTFRVRIGINSGPVVAGIVGIKKFAYDIWGDTVNSAARMEFASETGCINISESTYKLVSDHFLCENRGMIDVKGKGAVTMYYVIGRKDGASL